jgi:transposase-like protein
MGFQDIPVEVKVKAVCAIIGGEKIQLTARKYSITRPSLYTWAKRTQQAIEKVLKPY